MQQLKPLSIKEFAELMLASLTITPYNMGKFIAKLPANYKQIIQCILTTKNNWKNEFSILIDIEAYFKNHFGWENQLAKAIKELLSSQNKEILYDLENDELTINYTKEEVKKVLKKYDETTKNIMTHFTNLLTSYIYSREYQEEFHDNFKEAISTIIEIKEAQSQLIEDTLNENSSKKIKKNTKKYKKIQN